MSPKDSEKLGNILAVLIPVITGFAGYKLWKKYPIIGAIIGVGIGLFIDAFLFVGMWTQSLWTEWTANYQDPEYIKEVSQQLVQGS